jgi:hypothetical protein
MCKPKEPSSNFRNNLGANEASSVRPLRPASERAPPDPFRPRY